MSWLITILRDVPDPRTGNATRHDLLDLLAIALTASIWAVRAASSLPTSRKTASNCFVNF